jgi:hypothetical protein
MPHKRNTIELVERSHAESYEDSLAVKLLVQFNAICFLVFSVSFLLD